MCNNPAKFLLHETTYLSYHCADPDSEEYVVTSKAGHNITLPMNFTCIYLIKQSHHDEGVEYYGEVFCGGIVDPLLSTVINVEYIST